MKNGASDVFTGNALGKLTTPAPRTFYCVAQFLGKRTRLTGSYSLGTTGSSGSASSSGTTGSSVLLVCSTGCSFSGEPVAGISAIMAMQEYVTVFQAWLPYSRFHVLVSLVLSRSECWVQRTAIHVICGSSWPESFNLSNNVSCLFSNTECREYWEQFGSKMNVSGAKDPHKGVKAMRIVVTSGRPRSRYMTGS